MKTTNTTIARDRLQEVLLTGYPGFIGKRLSRELLRRHPKAKLICLVEESYLKSANATLESLAPTQQNRVRLLAGDVSKLHLGLSGKELKSLDEVTHIFHLAANHSFNASADLMERTNFDGTRHMLHLAKSMPKLKRLIHFSTCYVSGNRRGVITETELKENQAFRNSYEETKYLAECLVEKAKKDLPITIIRPSIVVGDSKTGVIDHFDGIYTLGIALATSPVTVPIPLPGEGIAPLNLVPVDFVTRATVALATDKRSLSHTYHLVDPNPLSSRHVYKLIAQKAGKRLAERSLNYKWVKRLLRVPGLQNITGMHAQAIDYINHLAIYNCSHTLAHLEGTGIMCPHFETYIDKLMKYASRSLGRHPLFKSSNAPNDDTEQLSADS
jgi:thioester reductase-like protein